jgi:hypothetical protein
MDLVLKKYKTNRIWTDFIYLNDILAGTIYRLTYDGIDFQLARPYSDEFNNKYKIEIGEYIVVPPNTQYWLYGDII